MNKRRSAVRRYFKSALIGIVIFFGSGFSIMAFHNDIGIRGVFEEISSLITGTGDSGVMVLELSYAFGLMAGILIFFNLINICVLLFQTISFKSAFLSLFVYVIIPYFIKDISLLF